MSMLATFERKLPAALALVLFLAGLLWINPWSPVSQNTFVYLLCLICVCVFALLQKIYFDRQYFLSFFANVYMICILLMAVGVWKWGGDGQIIRLNEHTFKFLSNGKVAFSALAGCLSFLSAQLLVWNVVNVIMPWAAERATLPPSLVSNDAAEAGKIKVFMVIVAVSWLLFHVLNYTLIYLNPHLTHLAEEETFLAAYQAVWQTVNSVLGVVVLNMCFQKRFKTTAMVVFALSLSFIAFSYGNRGPGALMMVSLLFLLLTYRRIKVPYWAFLSSGLVAAVIFSFWGYVRFSAYSASFPQMARDYREIIQEQGVSLYIYDSIPVLGQNLAHYAGYMFLYDNNQPSTFVPYTAGILNVLPRSIGLSLGLPVDPYKTHAWLLADYVIHLGGGYLFGDPYWLGGILMVVIFNAIYGFLFILIDLYFKEKSLKNRFVAHYIVFTVMMVGGFGYGFSSWIRPFYLLLMLEALFLLYSRREDFIPVPEVHR